MPPNTTSAASGTAGAVARPPLTSHILSSDPCRISVGTRTDARRPVRSPEATAATACRAVPAGFAGPVIGPPGPVPDGRLVEREAR